MTSLMSQSTAMPKSIADEAAATVESVRVPLPVAIDPLAVHPLHTSQPADVWGLPFRRWTMDQTLAWIDAAVIAKQPRQVITANVHTCMVAEQSPELHRRMQDREAVAVVADGMPIVWASELAGRSLPERVAGSELITQLAQRAAAKGHRVYLLGGRPEVLDEAAVRLNQLAPALQVVGTHSPPFRERSEEEEAAICRRVADSGADIVLVAMGQPAGELWLARNLPRLGVSVGIQLGASFDFVAGRVRRAPRWLQVVGGEWLFRLAMEPRRLLGRYVANLRYLVKAMRTQR